jgi:DNA primase
MLCELPTPHGAVFAWLERQLHEHGPLPWEALRLEILGQPDIEWALQAMSNAALAHDPSDDAAPELRDLLNRLLIERIKEQETQAIEDSQQDPAALIRYRELVARRLQLEKNPSGGIIQG